MGFCFDCRVAAHAKIGESYERASIYSEVRIPRLNELLTKFIVLMLSLKLYFMKMFKI